MLIYGSTTEIQLRGLAMIAFGFMILAIWRWGLPLTGLYRRAASPAAPTFEADPENRLATPTTTDLVANVRRYRAAKRRHD